MLKNKTILIGKEPGNGRLLIAVQGAGRVKVATLGEVGCVPNSVSRCKPAEDIAHCKITIGPDSVMTLANLKPQNVTFVNGTEIITKRITPDSSVSLGKDHYAVNLNTVLETAKKLVAQDPNPKPVEVSIKHLKAVWNHYDTKLLNLQIEQQKRANQQRLQGILSQLGTLCLIIPSVIPQIPIPNEVRAIVIVCAIGMSIYFFYKNSKTEDSFVIKKRELDQKLMNDYVCPNKDCNHYMGAQPYKILSQNKKCPYCGCKYSEK